MKILSTLLMSILVLASSSVFAQWQWIDKDGRKVFSDRAPPPEIAEKNIVKRPGGAKANAATASTGSGAASGATSGTSSAASGTPASPGGDAQAAPLPLLAASGPKGSGLDKELEARRKQAADAEAAKRKAEEERAAKVRQDNCARARQGKASIDSGARIARTNAAGEREIMDEAALAEERKRLDGIIASECK